jgi:phosphate butyryltransferase
LYKSFQEIEEYILNNNIMKTIALAGSHDDDALAAVVNARRKGVVRAILIGDEEKTKQLLTSMGEDLEYYRFIDEKGEAEAAKLACSLVKNKEADMPMKGLMPTATFLRPVLDKIDGFVIPQGLISQATVYQYEKEKRLLIISDCAINIAPVYEDKFKIIQNCVTLARQLGNECPKVAVLAPVEVVNPVMQSTIDAAMLSKAAERGQIKSCIVDGPLALDNAVSAEAAKHKNIRSQVAGCADVLIMPDLCAGNIFTKSLVYFSDGLSSGTITGTTTGVIMTSRSDTAANKYNSILTASIQSI